MTRLAIIFSLLFVTPAWAVSAERIVLDGQHLAITNRGDGITDFVVKYEGKIYPRMVAPHLIKCFRPSIKETK